MMSGELSKSEVIAFFDFDGTLTLKDSFLSFLQFTHGFKHYLNLLLLSPVITFYKLRIISNSRAKEVVFGFYYKGMSMSEFNKKCREFCSHALPRIIRREAYEKLKWHLQQGHRVVVVSASFETILLPWIKAEGLEILGTRMEVFNSVISGKISGENCYGIEKVKRIQSSFALLDAVITYGYGDSRGDKEMLELVNYKFYRRFN